MDIKLIVAIIGLSGVVVSAIVQYLLGRRGDKAKKTVEIRAQAYLDLVNAVSEIASFSRVHKGSMPQEQLTKLIQAKSRVVLIGSDSVVGEVHAFFTKHEKLNTDASFDSFSKLVAAMRYDLAGKSKSDLKILTEALFGKSS